MAFISGVGCKISDTRGPIRMKLWRVYRVDPEIEQRHIFKFRQFCNDDVLKAWVSSFPMYFPYNLENNMDRIWQWRNRPLPEKRCKSPFLNISSQTLNSQINELKTDLINVAQRQMKIKKAFRYDDRFVYFQQVCQNIWFCIGIRNFCLSLIRTASSKSYGCVHGGMIFGP